MPEIWFTSDLHYRHKFLADLRGIGRERLDEHDEMLRDNYVARVGKRDTVYFLGDLSFGRAEETRKFFMSLPGIKNLLVGNHDPHNVRNLPWASVNDLLKINIDGQTIVMCHYPMLTWQNAHKGSWHFHGHTHGNLRTPDTNTRIDVGVDCSMKYIGIPYSPFEYSELAAIMSDRVYDFVDHHDGGEAIRNGEQQVIPERKAE